MRDDMQHTASDSAVPVALDDAVSALQAGLPVVFPTDTVYGLGVAVHAAHDCSQLYDIKKRPDGKPVAWLVGSIDDLARYGTDVPDWALDLARAHWPGALTLIVRASDAVPRAFQSEEGTIGLRMPASDIALALITACGCPLATTSANLSGSTAPATYDELEEPITHSVGAVIKGAVPSSGIASTVVDCTGKTPRVLRQGDVMI